MNDQKTAKQQPFFAQFLEAQMPELPESEGGTGAVDNAAGSSLTSISRDQSTAPSKDGYHTMKYPSDSDDTV